MLGGVERRVLLCIVHRCSHWTLAPEHTWSYVRCRDGLVGAAPEAIQLSIPPNKLKIAVRNCCYDFLVRNACCEFVKKFRDSPWGTMSGNSVNKILSSRVHFLVWFELSTLWVSRKAQVVLRRNLGRYVYSRYKYICPRWDISRGGCEIKLWLAQAVWGYIRWIWSWTAYMCIA